MSLHANAGGGGNLRLPEFWPHAPILWFARAECLFMLRGVTTQLDRFCHVVASLPHEVMRACADLVETTPAEDPYTQLKQRLLASHQLTPFQRGEKLLDLPMLGAAKPSELMHQMLELCPKGDETSTIFQCLFLRRLPADLRVMLAHLDHADLKELARKADELWALKPRSEVLATIQQEETVEEPEIIAAVWQQGLQLCGQQQVCLGGKRVSRGAVNTVTPDSPASLAHVEDKQTGQQYLVDTGAAYSVIPFSSTAEPRGPPLRGAGGSNIACWGREKRTIQLGGMKFTWSFLKAAVKFPLIGADFLRSFKLLVDLDGGNLTVKKSGYKILTTAVPSAGFFASVCSPAYMPVVPPAVAHQTPTLRQNHGPFPKLLAEFADVCNSSKLLPAATHQVLHEINTSGRPVASKYRRLDADKLAAAKEEFRSLEQQGIIRRSKSSWASPLHMVKKGDGSWRPCGDFRRLNLQTEPDKYSVPNIADLTAKLHGARVFSKLDLRKGYHQVPVKPADVPKTAICTPFGLFEFIRMPCGLKNAGQTFQ